MRSYDEFALFGQILKNLYLEKISISPSSDDIRQILKEHSKLVVALNHGPALAPPYINAAIIDIFLKNGGSQRSPMIIVWKHFYRIPLLRHFFRYLTQVEEAFDFDQYIEQFKNKGYNDVLVMPEGENCSFGNGIDVEPFLSPRFIELAIRANTPILLAVHYGTHKLARLHSVTEKQKRWLKWLPKKNVERLEASGILSLPNWTYGKLPDFTIAFQIYEPTLTLNQLAESKDERLEQLHVEAAMVREKMQAMVNALKAEKVIHVNHSKPEIAKRGEDKAA